MPVERRGQVIGIGSGQPAMGGTRSSIVKQAVMQPVLVHRGQLVSQRLIGVFDNVFIAFHALLLFAGALESVERLKFDV
jgi:hypothetical protein